MERNEATSMTERLARALDAHIEGPDRLTMEDAIALRDELRRLSADARRLAFVYGDTKTTSNALIELELRLLSGEKPTIEEVRAAIDQAMDGK